MPQLVAASLIESRACFFVPTNRIVPPRPVSSPGSSKGCYRTEKMVLPDGRETTRVVLDTQPCVECGTCALMARTKWEHPRGGKGVQYRWG